MNPANFNREAATVAMEASDDKLAREIAALAQRRALTRLRVTKGQEIKAKRLVRTTGYCALAAVLLAAMASCAYFMNATHGLL